MFNYLRLMLDAWLTTRGNAFGQRGATMIEYALIVALIAVAVIVAVASVQGGITNIFGSAANALSSPNSVGS